MSIFSKLTFIKLSKFNFTQFDFTDLSTNYELKFLCDNHDSLINYFNTVSYDETSIDTLIDYFFLKKYSEYKKLVDTLQPNESIVKIKEVTNLLVSTLNKISKDKLFKLINLKFKEIYLIDNLFLFDEIFVFCMLDTNKTKDFITYLSKTNISIFIRHMDNQCITAKIFDNLEWCTNIFNIENFKKYENSPIIEQILSFIKKYFWTNKTRQEFLSLLTPIHQFLYDSVKRRINNLSNIDEKWMANGEWNILETICNYFIEIRIKGVEDWNCWYSKIQEYKNKYLERFGEKSEIKMTEEQSKVLEKAIDQTFNINKKWRERLFCLTHSCVLEGTEYVFSSYWENIGKSTPYGIVDQLFMNDNYFFNSKLTHLTISNEMYFNILITHFLNSTESVYELTEQLYTLNKFIFTKKNIIFEEIKLHEKYEILGYLLALNIKYNKQETKKNLLKSTQFATISYLCGLIEYFLRNLYYKEYEFDYYDSYVNLNTALSDDTPLIKIINKHIIKITRYFLLKINNIGLNIRNIIAHFDFDYANDLLCEKNVLLCLLILITFINEISIKFQK